MGCMYGVCVWGVCMVCVYGVYVWGVCMGCMYIRTYLQYVIATCTYVY